MALLAALAAAAPAASATGAGRAFAVGNFLAGIHARQMSDYAAIADYLARVLAQDPDNVDLLQAHHRWLS